MNPVREVFLLVAQNHYVRQGVAEPVVEVFTVVFGEPPPGDRAFGVLLRGVEV